MKRIPLEKRLSAGGSREGWPCAAWLYVEDYFLCLSQLSGGRAYADYYKKLLWGRACGNIRDTFLAEAVAKALMAIYPAETGIGLLYRILVEPFSNKSITGGNGT